MALLQTVVVDTLTDNPELAVVLVAIMRVGLAYQRGLNWYEYRTLHGLRVLVFPILAKYTPYKNFVNEKGGRDDAEYLLTLNAPVKDVAKRLKAGDGVYHLLSSVKKRTVDDQYSKAHLVWTHGSRQTEAYLFTSSEGGTDVYVHTEPSVSRPIAHLTRGQKDGDTEEIVTEALAETS